MSQTMKKFLSIFVIASLLITISTSSSPLIISMLSMFTNTIFNIQFGLFLMIVYFIIVQKYEVNIKDIQTMILTCILLLVLNLFINNTAFSTMNDLYLVRDSYLISMILFNAGLWLKKKGISINYHYLLIMICLVIIGITFIDYQLNSTLHFIGVGIAQLIMLFWLNCLQEHHQVEKQDIMIHLLILVVIIAILLQGYTTDIILITCVHLLTLCFIEFMRFVLPKKYQIYQGIIFVIIFMILNVYILPIHNNSLLIFNEFIRQSSIVLTGLAIYSLKNKYASIIIAIGLGSIVIFNLLMSSQLSMDIVISISNALTSMGILWIYPKAIKSSYKLCLLAVAMFIILMFIYVIRMGG